jgi:phosphinothricin acetyltransferase
LSEQIVIREATGGDIAAIAAIYGESVRTGVASYELEPPSLDEMRRRHANVIAGGYPYIVAEIAGTVAGYAYASAFRPRPAYRFLVENSIYLDEKWRGRGIGTQLLNRLLEACEARGYRQVIAVIGGAQAASVALHRKAGFRSIGRIEASGYKFGRWLDTELMQRSLGDGSRTLPE